MRDELTTGVRLALVGDDGAPLHRPVTRGDCASVPRPCPFATCRYSLLADVSRERVIDFSGGEDEPLPAETCALDLADADELTLEEVGNILGLTRERVRQIEATALRKVRSPRMAKALAEYSVARR